jgi:urate oxidase
MFSELTWNRYGKSRVRLVKVRREHEPHELVDLSIDVQLEGAFTAVYADGDNQSCLATDTMKNTVYALARHDPLTHVESFALRLAEHFATKLAVSWVRISATEYRWDRITAGGRPHPHAFIQGGPEHWTTVVTHEKSGVDVTSGLADLMVLKTSDSAFSGFPRDAFTTLPDTEDRILATSVTATWKYRAGASDFGARRMIRQLLVESFAAHESRSVQHTLYAMAEAVLDARPDIKEVTLKMPNRHHLLVDLTPFGLDNPNEIFVATEQPFGLIEATVSR